MGRVFEKRKHKMFARFDRMAKGFQRLGKEIVIAVKQAGPLPENNPRLRAAIATARGINMPKHLIEGAIKRASSKEEGNFEEIVYEGYGPHGVAILCECATDNTNRSIANIRSYFSRHGGAVGKTGSLDFIFSQKGVFKIAKGNLDPDELELELIDHGLDDLAIDEEENQIIVYTAFGDYAKMQKALEARHLEVVSSELERIPQSYADVPEDAQDELLELVDKIEADDDVQKVYHNMR